jgi:hypothetical protein
MFRTRDFVLVLTAVTFLLMAIGVTVFTQQQSAAEHNNRLQPATLSDGEYTAVSVNSHEFSRAQKLQEMQEKIAASSELSITAPEPVEVIEEVITSTSSSTPDVLAQGVQLCPAYTELTRAWSPVGVEIAEVEGARLVYRMSAEAALSVEQGTNSTSVSTPMQAQREVLVQLPVRNLPVAQSSCIPSDVIGIANDGSLIRNNEAGVYGIFNSSTLVGYALDGFPIYGASADVGDVCGGMMTSEGYRYQISPQRDTIINCYSAPPIRL